jgi:hypothetical protein
MSTTSNTSESDIDRLFKGSQAAAGFQFLYTLVRVDGIQCWDGYKDEFLQLHKLLNDSTFACSLGNYQQLSAYPGPIKLLQNLVNCVQGGLYDVSPLRPLVKGAYPNLVRPTPQEIVNFIVTNLRNAGFPNLADLFASAYDSDPITFVKDSYFECVVGLKAKAKAIATQTFGANHEYVRLLFEKSEADGVSLSDLRSELAHGGVTLLDKTHEALITKNLFTMGTITREFLLRVLFRLQPSDEVPTWCQEFKFGMSAADPRTTMWTTTGKTFPQGTSWRIRPEWCE